MEKGDNRKTHTNIEKRLRRLLTRKKVNILEHQGENEEHEQDTGHGGCDERGEYEDSSKSRSRNEEHGAR